MIILSVDYGDVRTGIAICDTLEILATPLCVITEKNQDSLIKKVADLATENKAETIIIGNPKNMDGSSGFRSERCAEFAKKVESISNINVVLWDERMTTVSAHNFLNEVNVRGKKRKNVVDAVSATIILQSYLDYRKNNIKE